jgi:plastocyanin
MRRAALGGLLAALALAGPAAAADHAMPMGPGTTGVADGGLIPEPTVPILFSAFKTPLLNVVTGDTVRWSNDSARAHDVVSDDHSFDSGRLPVGATFQHRFDQPGAVPYYCSLHPFMTGEIDVYPVLLDTPTERAGSGKPFVLSGRVASGTTGAVAIEGDSGAGFAPAGTAAINADGTFRTTVVPRTTTTYRAVLDGQDSPAVPLIVLDHKVAVTAMAHGRTTMFTVKVSPAAPGQTVVLQLDLRERFGWWPVQQAKLGKDSTATFAMARRSRVPARVLLTQPDGATELARSRTVHLGPVHRKR